MSKNDAVSTVATAPSPATSGTSLTVAAGHGTRFYVGQAFVFPAGKIPTPATCEIVTITGIATDTLTIVRTQESSAARTVVIGDQIMQGVTAGMWDALGTTTLPSALVASNVVGFGGDSITLGSGASDSAHTFVYLSYVYAGGLKLSSGSYNGGVSGDKSADLLARMDTVIASSTGPLHIMIGTNDAGVAVAYSTYQANIKAIVAKAQAARRPISFSTIPPRGAGTTQAIVDRTALYNVFLRTYCYTQGIPVAEVYGALVNPTTGLLPAANDSGDNIHPSDLGHRIIAQTVYPVISAQVPSISWPVRSLNEGGLVADPLMATATGNLDWIAGFFGAETITPVAASGGDLPAGRWMRLTNPNASGSTQNTTMGIEILPAAGWAIGDTLAVFLYARGSAVGALNKVGICSDAGVFYTVPIDQPPTATPGPIGFVHTMAVGETTLWVAFILSAPAATTAWVDIGACDVFNLTTGSIVLSI